MTKALRRCLVLGGGGFQGRHLCNRLLREGYHVRVFDRVTAGPCGRGQVECLSGDFSDHDAVERALVGVDVVFHLVSTTVPKTSNDGPAADIAGNVIPSIRLLEAACRQGVQRLIFFSSGGTVYGIPQCALIPEDHPTDPICSYGIQKLAIEKYLHMFHRIYGLDYAVMRISNPYGSGQPDDRGQGVVSTFMGLMRACKPIEIWGDGSVVRDYIHVDDVVDAAVRLITYRGEHKVFNIGSGHGMSLNEMIAVIARVLNCKPDVRYTPARALDVPSNVLDIRLAFQELGWAPEIMLEEGLGMVKGGGSPDTHTSPDAELWRWKA